MFQLSLSKDEPENLFVGNAIKSKNVLPIKLKQIVSEKQIVLNQFPKLTSFILNVAQIVVALVDANVAVTLDTSL